MRRLIEMGTLRGSALHSAPTTRPATPSLRPASPNPPATLRSRRGRGPKARGGRGRACVGPEGRLARARAKPEGGGGCAAVPKCRRPPHAIALAFIALFVLPACDDRSYREIGASIDVLTKKKQELPGPAIERLRTIGRRAVPQIETALHTASPRGKVNLVTALAAIGEPESAAILQHFAVYDANPEVRAACEEVLARWASGGDRRAAPAKQAIARIEEKRRLGQAE